MAPSTVYASVPGSGRSSLASVESDMECGGASAALEPRSMRSGSATARGRNQAAACASLLWGLALESPSHRPGPQPDLPPSSSASVGGSPASSFSNSTSAAEGSILRRLRIHATDDHRGASERPATVPAHFQENERRLLGEAGAVHGQRAGDGAASGRQHLATMLIRNVR